MPPVISAPTQRPRLHHVDFVPTSRLRGRRVAGRGGTGIPVCEVAGGRGRRESQLGQRGSAGVGRGLVGRRGRVDLARGVAVAVVVVVVVCCGMVSVVEDGWDGQRRQVAAAVRVGRRRRWRGTRDRIRGRRRRGLQRVGRIVAHVVIPLLPAGEVAQ